MRHAAGPQAPVGRQGAAPLRPGDREPALLALALGPRSVEQGRPLRARHLWRPAEVLWRPGLRAAQLETALLITGLASAVTEICGVVVVLQVSDTPVILIIPLVEFGI